MKKLLLTAALCLTASVAWAQNTTCSDRAQSDDSNACANTRFVHDAIAAIPPVTAIPYTGVTGLPANTILGNNTGGTANAIALTPTQTTAMLNVFTSGLKGLVPASGGGTTNFLRADGTFAAPPSASSNASQFGILCDGVTDDGPAFMTAFNALAGAPLILPAGTCRIATKAFYNTTNPTPGILNVPGITLIGQGRDVTKIEADVANNYALALNSAWAAAHKSMYILTPSAAGGSLATNTYFVAITVNKPATGEVTINSVKSVAVTGPTGSIQLTLEPIDTGYTYNVYVGTANPPVNYATVAAANAVNLPAGSITITAVGGAHAIPTTPQAIWQTSNISNLSFTNTTATAGASALLWFRTAYSTIDNVYFKGMSGNGVDMPNWTGDVDGSFVTTINNSKFDDIDGWCLMAAGNTLEFSNLTVSNSVFNLCGTTPTNYHTAFTMTAITNANPGVVTTASPHTLLFGDQVLLQAVAGMALPTGHYRACGTVSGSTFSLCDLNGDNVNTTALGAYTASSGNERLVFRPPQMQANGNGPTMSGAIAYTGLISNFINNGFTQNRNTNIYFSEAGANDQALMSGNDFENTDGVAMYIATVVGLNWLTGECLNAVSIAVTVQCFQLGTGLNKGGAQYVEIQNMKVRNDYGAALGFVQVKGAGGLIYRHTVSVRNMFWQVFSGIAKYSGFGGNPFPFFWARFDGQTGAVCTLADSFNITSCVRNSQGNYTLTFTVPSLDTSYFVAGSAWNAGAVVRLITTSTFGLASVVLICTDNTGAAQDCAFVNVQGLGNPQ